MHIVEILSRFFEMIPFWFKVHYAICGSIFALAVLVELVQPHKGILVLEVVVDFLVLWLICVLSLFSKEYDARMQEAAKRIATFTYTPGCF